jgi:hypothetical protein
MTALTKARFVGSSALALSACLFIFSGTVAAEDESNDTKIARAMSAAPSSISAEATIMDVDGTPFTTDVVGYSYMLQGDAMVNNDNPAATDPNDGGVWVQEGPHLMLLLPSGMLDGVNRDPSAGGPYVMWGDTPLIHVMVPVGDRSE